MLERPCIGLLQATRTLLRQRALTLTALFSLTLGIGITTGTFTLLNALILRPLPGVERQDRLVSLALAVPDDHGPGFPWRLSYPDFQAVQRAASAFSGIAAAARADVSVTLDAAPQLAAAELVTPGYFGVLGTRAVRGRLLAAGDTETPVVVVAHEYWQARLGGGDVIGRQLLVNGHAFTIIGIAPEHFQGMTPADATAGPDERLALWLPLSATAYVRPPGVRDDPLHSLEQRWLRVVARLREGAEPAVVEASLPALGAALAAEFPAARAGARVLAGDLVFGAGSAPGHRTLIFVGFLAVPFVVLLIACVNVAGLLLASGVSRQRELAIRLSLGASRRSLLALLMRESLLLAFAAGALSLIVALWTRRIAALFAIHAPADVPLDARVLLFAGVTALGTGLVFGMLPALRATRVQPARSLAGGASSESGRTARLRGGLVATQLALCCVLLVTCALFVRSLGRGLEVETGFAEDELLLVDVNLDVLGVDAAQGAALHQRLLEEALAVPGIAAVGTAGGLPLAGTRDVRVSTDADVAHGARTGADLVGPGYFEASGLALEAGQGFDASDRGVPARRVVVNRALAERLWPGNPAVGRTLRLGEGGAEREFTVIGVARSARAALDAPPAALVYLPLEAEYSPYRVYLFRAPGAAAGGAARVVPAIRAAFRAADTRLPVVSVISLRDVRRDALLPYRLMSAGLGSLGLVALLLAAVGLYGLISYNVARRTREIGIRTALGADRARITRWVVRGSLLPVMAGLAFGLPAAAAVAFAIRRGLFGIPPLDPLSFGAVAALLLLVTLLGAILPARRAAAVQPGIAIRTE